MTEIPPAFWETWKLILKSIGIVHKATCSLHAPKELKGRRERPGSKMSVLHIIIWSRVFGQFNILLSEGRMK